MFDDFRLEHIISLILGLIFMLCFFYFEYRPDPHFQTEEYLTGTVIDKKVYTYSNFIYVSHQFNVVVSFSDGDKIELVNRLYYYNYAIGEEVLLKKICNYYRDKLTDVTYEIVEEVAVKKT